MKLKVFFSCGQPTPASETDSYYVGCCLLSHIDRVREAIQSFPKGLIWVEETEARYTLQNVAAIIDTRKYDSSRRWAEEKRIWLISDEVYDLYSYTQPHIYARPYSSSSVISAFSLSKAFGMAGYRCGFLQGPAEVIDMSAFPGNGALRIEDALVLSAYQLI